MVVTIPNNGWKPREDQLPLWAYLENGGKRAVQVAHRRWGKDDVALHFTATQMMQRVGNYWHMLPEYNQARKVVWNAINPRTNMLRIDEVFPQELRKATRQQEMSITLKNGSIWQLVGSDNYNSLVGSPPVAIVFSEFALANPMCWAYLDPVLQENGGWALFIYTSRGDNHGRRMYDTARLTEGWFGQLISAEESPVFTQVQLNAILAQYRDLYGLGIGETLFNQEYMCSFEGGQVGAYYRKQILKAREDGRITSVPCVTGAEVHTFWDLGVSDAMAIWFIQAIGREFRVIDYYENTGYGLEHYAKILKEKGYLYGNHYMPHDAMDRELTNNEIALSRGEVAENLGIKPVVAVSRAKNFDIIINVHIPAVRNILAQCVFDEKKCKQGIDALENYHAEYDEQKKILGPRPVHDWSSHAADAFRVFAIGYEAPKPPAKEIRIKLPRHQQQHGWMM
jgi:phage terminase large subunit